MENSQAKAPCGEKVLKPCCACKATRNMRDECIRNYNETQCLNFIEAHNSCLREKGFSVPAVKN